MRHMISRFGTEHQFKTIIWRSRHKLVIIPSVIVPVSVFHSIRIIFLIYISYQATKYHFKFQNISETLGPRLFSALQRF